MTPAEARVKAWREDPRVFVREVFGAEPDGWQDEVLAAFPTRQRIAMPASKGPGKSTVLSWCAWNFLATRPHPKVAATSISGDNLRDCLWAEMAKWQAKSAFLQRAFTWSKERIFANDHPETWWASKRTWSRDANPVQQGETLAGLHADYVLFLVDEAGGVPDSVVATAEAALASGEECKLVLGGNPTQAVGPLFRACTREAKLWFIVRVNGDPDNPKRSQRVSIQWAREQIEKYGRESPWVLVNVFGEFPPTGSNQLVGLEEVQKAAERTVTEAEYRYAPKVLGVDVARFGDDKSVLFRRQGKVAFRPDKKRGLDTMELAGQVALSIDEWQPDAVFVDETGLGAGVVDRLRQLGHQVVGVQFGERALRAQPKLADRRTEMWWEMAEWLKGGCIPNDADLIADLTGPTYHFLPDGRLKLESKEELKKRGLHSPDDGDALALTFAAPVAVSGGRMVPGGRTVHEFDPLGRA